MKRVWIGLAALAGACASNPADVAAPAAQGKLTPEQVVAARQAGYHLNAATFGSLKSAIDSGQDVKALTFAARGLQRWARTAPMMFPEGTGPGVADTRAKAEVWTNRADFDAKAVAFEAAATRLVELSQAGDKAGFATQWAATRDLCSSCHNVYRAEAQGGGAR